MGDERHSASQEEGQNSPTKIAKQSLSSSELKCLKITLIANKILKVVPAVCFSPLGEQASASDRLLGEPSEMKPH